ncbi:hypothetical protein [Nonomuraea sp. NPDC050691]|uniref:hypothetical protein n=1 Tax=Nonomuraea sp. NPDC050691 TaxID=3155661 RepID=UPI0034119103
MPPTALRVLCLAASATLVASCSSGAATETYETQTPVYRDYGTRTDIADETDDEEPGQIEICVAKGDRRRVADQRCDDALTGYAWYYLPATAKIPANGSKAKRGSFRRPDTTLSRASAKGGRGSRAAIEDYEDRVEICVRRTTRARVSDSRCDDEDRGYTWYYIRIGRRVPAVGRLAERGSFRAPDGLTYRARTKGGPGAKAAIDDEPEQTGQDDSDFGSTTSCGMTVNGSCVGDSDDGSSTSTGRTCAFVGKRRRPC